MMLDLFFQSHMIYGDKVIKKTIIINAFGNIEIFDNPIHTKMAF